MTPRTILWVSAVMAIHAGARIGAAQDEMRPVRIDVVANDYAFMPLPPAISGGLTMFTFANHGKVVHEMSIGRLRDGATIDDLQKASKDGRPLREIVSRPVGVLIAGAGKAADGRLLVDLIPGETYFMICNFKDKPDAATHLSMGMFATFRPR